MRSENPFPSTSSGLNTDTMSPCLLEKDSLVTQSRWSSVPSLTASGSSGSLSSMVSLSCLLQQQDQARSKTESSDSESNSVNDSDDDSTMDGSGSRYNCRSLPKEIGSDEQVRDNRITFEQIK